jgi:phosphate/sulfate permease
MDWEFILGLGAITLLVVGLFIYGGQKVSRAVAKQAPESELAVEFTPAGTVLTALMVGCWVLFLAARALAPQSSLGAFVGNSDGLAVAFAATLIFFPIVAVILQRLGYPIAKRGDRWD